MSELQQLKYILQKSVERNWEKPLTNIWLLNMLKKLEKDYENDPMNHIF